MLALIIPVKSLIDLFETSIHFELNEINPNQSFYFWKQKKNEREDGSLPVP